MVGCRYIPGDPQWAGGAVFCDERKIVVEADAPATFAAVCRIGGGNGWYAADILWRVRGIMDKAVGGPGLRRGGAIPSGSSSARRWISGGSSGSSGTRRWR